MQQINFPIDILEIGWWIHNLGGVPTKTKITVDGYDIRVDAELKQFAVVIFHTADGVSFKYRWKDVSIYSTEAAADRKLKSVRSRRDRLSPIVRQYRDDWE